MSSTTKYAPAPQEDVEDNYTQPPPSYQAAGPSSANDDAALFDGAPRNSQDEIPDDFKVRPLIPQPSHFLPSSNSATFSRRVE